MSDAQFCTITQPSPKQTPPTGLIGIVNSQADWHSPLPQLMYTTNIRCRIYSTEASGGLMGVAVILSNVPRAKDITLQQGHANLAKTANAARY